MTFTTILILCSGAGLGTAAGFLGLAIAAYQDRCRGAARWRERSSPRD